MVFESAGLRLAGTLALPGTSVPPEASTLPGGSQRYPCVLMISGSGQVDRNESHKRMPLNVMGELAAHLAERGIGSLRYDKRGVGESEGDYWSTGFHDNVTDAAAALAYLKKHTRVNGDKIFALGHSEGAYIATRLAAGCAAGAEAGAGPDSDAGGGLAGAVLLAGGARSGEDELRWQGAQVAASLTGMNALLVRLLRIDIAKSQQKALDKAKRSQKDWHRTQLVGKLNAKWMREFLAYDPAGDLSRVNVPILAITGSKDIQVDPGNLERMASIVSAPFESHVVPDVTHLLRSDPGPPGLAAYKAQIKRPVDPRVKDLVTEWLQRQVRGAPPLRAEGV